MGTSPRFETRFAADEDDVAAAQRLRYEVFVEELGGHGALVDHEKRLERDRFDPFFQHLLLFDRARSEGDQVVGVYRVMTEEGAEAAGQFYSEDEYDLSPLRRSRRRLLELGRSCVHAKYRGGLAMYELWNRLAEFVTGEGIEVLFGVASFHGTDPEPLGQQLGLLHYRHLAPAELRVRAKEPERQDMDLLPEDAIDRRSAMLEIPSLIKAYLRLGGVVGDGAFIDREFNTTDVCLILDIAAMNPRQRAIYARGVDG